MGAVICETYLGQGGWPQRHTNSQSNGRESLCNTKCYPNTACTSLKAVVTITYKCEKHIAGKSCEWMLTKGRIHCLFQDAF